MIDSNDSPLVIMVNNKPETIFSFSDFGQLIEHNMGHEAKEYFEDLMSKQDLFTEQLQDNIQDYQYLTGGFEDRIREIKEDLICLCDKFTETKKFLEQITYNI